jgi:predicted alpha/beta-hydrolase family hydrolase
MTESPPLLIDGSNTAPYTLILAHGAGQGMRSDFMQWFAHKLCGDGLLVVRFEFPYMQAMGTHGKRRPPNPQPQLLATWRTVIQRLQSAGGGRERLLIGGKSMGGRMASLLADEEHVAGLVCLGYPFHAPGKPRQPRIAHLAELRTPTLICQGERDPFGRRDEVAGYRLSPAIRLHWLSDGEHSFKPRKASGVSETDNRSAAADAIREFAGSL